MGHLVNPISFRLNRNRFWNLVSTRVNSVHNSYFYTLLFVLLLKLIFRKLVLSSNKDITLSHHQKNSSHGALLLRYDYKNFNLLFPSISCNLNLLLTKKKLFFLHFKNYLMLLHSFSFDKVFISFIGFEKSVAVIRLQVKDRFYRGLCY